MSTEQIIDEIKKLSQAEELEVVEQAVSLRKEELRKKENGGDKKEETFGDLMKKIQALAEQIPPEELAKLPRDGAHNHDHYLYGTLKH